MKSYLLLIISLILFLACEDNNKDDPATESCDSIYSGTWAHTSSGTYENSDCTGELILNENFSGTSSFILADDCTGTSQDDFLCSQPSENSDYCGWSWSSDNNVVTTSVLGGAMQINYNVNGNKMSTTVIVTQMPDTQDEYTECQFSEYTKQ